MMCVRFSKRPLSLKSCPNFGVPMVEGKQVTRFVRSSGSIPLSARLFDTRFLASSSFTARTRQTICLTDELLNNWERI